MKPPLIHFLNGDMNWSFLVGVLLFCFHEYKKIYNALKKLNAKPEISMFAKHFKTGKASWLGNLKY